MNDMRDANGYADTVGDSATAVTLSAVVLAAGGHGQLRVGCRFTILGMVGNFNVIILKSRPGRLGVYHNVPGGRGWPLDVPGLAALVLHLSPRDALKWVEALVEGELAGGQPPAVEPAGWLVGEWTPTGLDTAISPLRLAFAARMSVWGVPVNVDALALAISTEVDPGRLRQLQALKNANVRGRVATNWTPEVGFGVRPNVRLPRVHRHIIEAPPGYQLLDVDVVFAGFASVALLTLDPWLLALARQPDPAEALAGVLGCSGPLDSRRSQAKEVFRRYHICGSTGDAQQTAGLSEAFPELVRYRDWVGQQVKAGGPMAVPTSTRVLQLQGLVFTPGLQRSALARMEQLVTADVVDRALVVIDRQLEALGNPAHIIAHTCDGALLEVRSDALVDTLRLVDLAFSAPPFEGAPVRHHIRLRVGPTWGSMSVVPPPGREVAA